MSSPRIGSLCTGYSGLDLGVQAAIGGETVWVSDIDKGSCKLLAHRHPDLPNLGDFTKTDWSTVEPIEILTAGFPCQPVSNAGKRLGDEDERWLWDDVARAVRELRPGLVVLENVRGLLTAGSGRLFGRVLGTLAGLGYDAQWHGLRAADVGAPHGRWRVFILATDTHRQGRGGFGRLEPIGRDADGRDHSDGPRSPGEPAPRLLKTPTSQLAINGGSQHPDKRRAGGHGPTLADEVEHLLPTPAVNDMGEGKTPEAWDDWTAKMKAAHGNGNGHGASLAIEAQRLLGTPTARDGKGSGQGERLAESARRGQVEAQVRLLTEGREALVGDGLTGGVLTPVNVEQVTEVLGGFGAESDGHTASLAPIFQAGLAKSGTNFQQTWGDYAAAIHRWEHTLGRTAPAPTQTSSKGNPQLAPAFVEWMMGLPAGWVTDIPGITRNEALKLCGNGVVPQQAEAALRVLLDRMEAAA